MRLGYLLTEEQTNKAKLISRYMGISPDMLISNSIDKLWISYLEAIGDEDVR